MAILVTGGTGYVGSHLVRRLVGRGESVTAVVRGAAAARAAEALGARPVPGDVTDLPALRAAMVGASAVIHLVAVNRERGGATFSAINHQGTANAVAAAREAGVRRFIHMGGLGLSSTQPYPFARTKGLGHDAVEASGLDYTILKPSIIFGPGDEFINVLAALIKVSPLVPLVGGGRTRFQPIWIDDVVSCFVACLDRSDTMGQSYDLGGPEVLTFSQVIDTVLAVLGTRRLKLPVPAALLRPAAALMARALPRPPVTPGLLDLLEVDTTTSSSATEAVFGLEPRRLRDGIDYVRDLTLADAVRIAVLGRRRVP